jgi:autotransporter-associated beta strand protein
MATVLLLACGGSMAAETWRTASGLFWTTPANWGETLPTQDGTADLLFSLAENPNFSQGTSTLNQDWNVRTITWNSTALSNGRVQLNGMDTTLALQGRLSNVSGGRVEVYANVSLANLQTWNDTSIPTTVFFGPRTQIYGSIQGIGGIRKTGEGTIRLDFESNSYSGGNVLAGGVLEVPNATALGSNPSVTFAGGTLRLAAYTLCGSSAAESRARSRRQYHLIVG